MASIIFNIKESGDDQSIDSCKEHSPCFDVELREQGSDSEELCLVFNPDKPGCSKANTKENGCNYSPGVSMACTAKFR